MSYINNIKDDNKGFTLVELIITVVILALVTAPFLSSFATAGKTNVKAKRRQQANNIGDYITEKFKATKTDQLDIILGGHTDGASGELLYDIPNDKLPSQYGTKYTAKVKLTPNPGTVNDEVTPVPVSLDATNSAIFMADFYKNDDQAIKTGPVTNRICTVNIIYDPTAGGSNPYHVSLEVNYYNGSIINKVYTAPKVELSYSSIPDLYLFYTPFSLSSANDGDKLIIHSELTDELNVHLTKQGVATHDLLSSNVGFEYKNKAGFSKNGTLSYLDSTDQLLGENLKVYTNMATTSNLVQTAKIDTLYKMEIEVKYDGESVLTYDSSKKDIE